MFENALDALQYMFAGNARFTVRSLQTGKHYTYRVRKAKDKDLWFVNILNGRTYSYMGIVISNPIRFKLTQKSKYRFEEGCVKAFCWTLNRLVNKKDIPLTLQIQHEGTCGRCGRPLTNPESIEKGIGPICANGMDSRQHILF